MKKKVFIPSILIIIIIAFIIYGFSQSQLSEEEKLIRAINAGISSVENETGTDLNVLKDGISENLSGYQFDAKNSKVSFDVRNIERLLYDAKKENLLSTENIIGEIKDTYTYSHGDIFIGTPHYSLTLKTEEYSNPWGEDYLVAYTVYNDEILYQIMGFQKIGSGELKVLLRGNYEAIDDNFPISLFKNNENNVYLNNNDLIDSQGNISKFERIQGSSSYKKNKNKIFYKDSILNGADYDSFRVIDIQNVFAIDNNYLYSKSQKTEISSIIGLDKNSFSSISGYYFKDSNNVYYWDLFFDKPLMVVTGADTETFRSGVRGKASDKNQNYYKGVAIID